MSYTTVQLPYGRSSLSVRVPSAKLLGEFLLENCQETASGDSFVSKALENPIGTQRLRELAGRGQKVAIVTSDITRPCPSRFLLPYIVDELTAAGVPDHDILVILALGVHRSMTEAEIGATVGPDVYRRIRAINHDPLDTVRLGITSAGTPMEFFRPLVEADLRICVGNVEFHYFAGYSGGAKAIMPGCASEAAVAANHAMMVRPEAASGRIENNPVRADIEEAVGMLGVDFILNVVVDAEHRVVGAAAGDVVAAHRDACQCVAARGYVTIPKKAGIALASAGGFPKDLNLYQAQKALDNAQAFVQERGIIILVAECREGFGNSTFESWFKAAKTPYDVLDRIQREFVLGGHKAAAVAAVLARTKVYLVSAMPPEDIRLIGMVPFDTVSEALDAALEELGSEADVIVIPQAASILPKIEEQ